MAHSARTPMPQAATLQDFLAIPEHQRFHEILDGQLVRKTMPNGHHASVQRRLAGLLDGYDDGSLHRQPGGWWLMSEVEILLPWGQVVRPDLAGWRCERLPEVTTEFPLRLRPDWICAVVSPSEARRDTVIKYRDYAKAGIPYYWLVDLKLRTLTALQLEGEHYTIAGEAQEGTPLQNVPPFELVEIAMEVLFRGVSREPESP